MVPYVFALNLILWGCGISFFSALSSYPEFMALTSGAYSQFFSYILWRIVFFLPLIVMIALFSVFVFLMRHPSITILSFILLTLIIVSSIALVIPLSGKLAQERGLFSPLPASGRASASAAFTPAVIRSDGTGGEAVWLGVFGDGKKVGPLILARPMDAHRPEVLSIFPEADLSTVDGALIADGGIVFRRGGGIDPLIEPWFVPFPAFSAFSGAVRSVMSGFRVAMTKGYTYWLLFSGSFFLAVYTLWLVCFASGWRMLNVIFSLTGFFLLFVLYPFVSEGGELYAVMLAVLPSSVLPERITPFAYVGLSAPLLVVGLTVAIKRRFLGVPSGGLV